MHAYEAECDFYSKKRRNKAAACMAQAKGKNKDIYTVLPWGVIPIGKGKMVPKADRDGRHPNPRAYRETDPKTG